MSNVATTNTPDGVPWCTKCNHPVLHYEVRTPVESYRGPEGRLLLRHTGEIIITLRCHGEHWSQSNWYGEQQPA